MSRDSKDVFESTSLKKLVDRFLGGKEADKIIKEVTDAKMTSSSQIYPKAKGIIKKLMTGFEVRKISRITGRISGSASGRDTRTYYRFH